MNENVILRHSVWAAKYGRCDGLTLGPADVYGRAVTSVLHGPGVVIQADEDNVTIALGDGTHLSTGIEALVIDDPRDADLVGLEVDFEGYDGPGTVRDACGDGTVIVELPGRMLARMKASDITDGED